MYTKTRDTRTNVGYVAFILTMLAMMFGLTACVVEAPPETEPQTQTQQEPTEPKKEEAEPEQPKETTSQEQARISAESYLDMGGFSKKGLVEQLEFEGFSTDDARYAVSAVDVSWEGQAVISAQGYMDMGGFSEESLVEQLAFEGFTEKQARHAASVVGF
jgi:hypothetical protein